jgi:transposase
MSKNNQDNTVTGQVSANIQENQIADPEVKSKKEYSPRRHYDNAYKARVLEVFSSCRDANERSAFLRKEGLYYSRIIAWKKEKADGKLKKAKQKKTQPRIDHLTQEVMQLKKKLAQAEAIIDLQKKVSELLGTHILPHDNNEEI